jgi:hypothetical protein
MRLLLSAALVFLVLGGIAAADPVSSPGVVACVRIDDAGAVTGAYILVSSGNAEDDNTFLTYFRGLKWNPKKPGEAGRNVWIPMGVALGGKKPPPTPDTCGPPNS